MPYVLFPLTVVHVNSIYPFIHDMIIQDTCFV